MSTVLAADTSTDVYSLALCTPDAVLAELAVRRPRRHAERLIPTLDFLLAETDLTLDAVDMLAVSIGPGSFTGLRIGVSMWKGLALAKKLPLVAVPTLDALARMAGPRHGVVCTLLDARMQEVFSAAYRYQNGDRVKTVPESAGPVEAFLESVDDDTPLLLGDGAAAYRERILAMRPNAIFAPAEYAAPRASAVAAEAFDRIAAGASTDPGAADPVYLRRSQAEELQAARSGAA